MIGFPRGLLDLTLPEDSKYADRTTPSKVSKMGATLRCCEWSLGD